MRPEGSDPALSIDRLTRRYGDLTVVDEFCLEVAAGEVTVLVGPNGCGKTTTVETALGLRRAHGGSVRIAGLDPWSVPQHTLAQLVGVQLQRGSLHARVKLREHGQQLDAAYGRAGQFSELAGRLGLTEALGRTFGALSGGQQRRALVASALMGRPQLCLLDEPTSGVDVESRNEIWSVVRARAAEDCMGVLVTTHDLVEAERHADQIVVMRHGRVVSAGPAWKVIGAAGVQSVVGVRGVPSVIADLAGSGDAIEVSRAAAEVVYAFQKGPAAEAWATELGARQDLLITRRAPTLEDAYLVLAAKDNAS